MFIVFGQLNLKINELEIRSNENDRHLANARETIVQQTETHKVNETQLTSQLDCVRTQNIQIQEQMRGIRKEMTQLQEELQTAETEIEDLKTENENLDLKFDNLKMVNQKLKFSSTKLSFANKEKSMKIENLNSELRKLHRKEQQAQSQIQQHEEELSKLHYEMNIRNGILEKLSGETLEKRNKEEMSSSKMSRMREKLKENEAIIENLRKDLENEERIKDQLIIQKNFFLERKKALRKELSKIRRDFSLYKIHGKAKQVEDSEHTQNYQGNIRVLFVRLGNMEEMLQIKNRKIDFHQKEHELQQKIILQLQGRVRTYQNTRLMNQTSNKNRNVKRSKHKEAWTAREMYLKLMILDLKGKVDKMSLMYGSKIVYYEKQLSLVLESLTKIQTRTNQSDVAPGLEVFKQMREALEGEKITHNNTADLEKVITYLSNGMVDPKSSNVFIEFLAFHTKHQMEENDAVRSKLMRHVEQSTVQDQGRKKTKLENQRLKVKVERLATSKGDLEMELFKIKGNYSVLLNMQEKGVNGASEDTFSDGNVLFNISRINEDISIISKYDSNQKSRFFNSKDKSANLDTAKQKTKLKTNRFNFTESLRKGFELN